MGRAPVGAGSSCRVLDVQYFLEAWIPRRRAAASSYDRRRASPCSRAACTGGAPAGRRSSRATPRSRSTTGCPSPTTSTTTRETRSPATRDKSPRRRCRASSTAAALSSASVRRRSSSVARRPRARSASFRRTPFAVFFPRPYCRRIASGTIPATTRTTRNPWFSRESRGRATATPSSSATASSHEADCGSWICAALAPGRPARRSRPGSVGSTSSGTSWSGPAATAPSSAWNYRASSSRSTPRLGPTSSPRTIRTATASTWSPSQRASRRSRRRYRASSSRQRRNSSRSSTSSSRPRSPSPPSPGARWSRNATTRRGSRTSTAGRHSFSQCTAPPNGSHLRRSRRRSL
mmetsp:Transcript_17783/g.61473  ORF Transcript_17783/g.61473 Transcript_17783/m.61473 type:complete len:349 (+) Transcript_17783:3366-4412(+)